MFKKLISAAFLLLLIFSGIFLNNSRNRGKDNLESKGESLKIEENISIEEIGLENIADKKIETEIEIVNETRKVPFVVQAPTGNWKDPVFQDACEEASVLMAMGWAKGIAEIDSQIALDEINNMAAYEDKTFGFNTNTDLKDVEKIFKDYFSYEKVWVMENIKIEDIKMELEKGNIILLPAFGQALKNPNFTQPGPITHMLVVIGYDREKGEFITNDPGTKRGENFRYQEKVLFDAIWQYPSGKKLIKIPKDEDIKKGMLIVSR